MESSKENKPLNVTGFEGILIHCGNTISGAQHSLKEWGIRTAHLSAENAPEDLNFSHPQPFGGGNIIC